MLPVMLIAALISAILLALISTSAAAPVAPANVEAEFDALYEEPTTPGGQL